MRSLVLLLGFRCGWGATVHTDGAPLGMVFSNTFDCMQVHVDLLTGREFCKDNVLCRR